MGQNIIKQSQMCWPHFSKKKINMHRILYLAVSHVDGRKIHCVRMFKKYDVNNYDRKIQA